MPFLVGGMCGLCLFPLLFLLNDLLMQMNHWLVERYVRMIIDSVISHAIQALVRIGDQTVVPAIELSKKLFAPQYCPWVAREIIELKEKKEPDEISSQKKKISQL